MQTNDIISIFIEHQYTAVLISILLSIIIAILGMVPSVFMTGINVAVFGVYYGLVISWLGEVIGAGVSFYLYKWGLKKLLKKKYSDNKYLNKILHAKGVGAWFLIFEARLIPFIPSGVVTFISSMSTVDILTFLSATALGKIPSIALEVFICFGIITISRGKMNTVITLVCLLLIYITYRLMYNKKS